MLSLLHLSVGLSWGSPPSGEDSLGVGLEVLRPPLSKLATDVQKYLQGENATNVTLGAVTGQADFYTSKGPGIKRILAEELKRRNVTVAEGVTFELAMDYRLTLDKERSAVEGVDIPQILLSVTIIDTRDGSRSLLASAIRDQVDMNTEPFRDLVCELFGIDCPDQGAGQTIHQFAKWLNQKKAEIVLGVAKYKERVETGEKPLPFQQHGPYQVEVLTRRGGGYQERVLEDHGGMAFVDLHRGDEYAVKLINNSEHDVAVTFTIDGLNVFMFSEHQDYRHFIVPKQDSLLVKGWHRTNEWSEAFVITRYCESEAAKVLACPSNEVGTITAQFAAAWGEDEEPPADEEGTAKSPNGTARGDRVSLKLQEVRCFVGRTRATINIRYDKPAVPAPRPANNARASVERNDRRRNSPT